MSIHNPSHPGEVIKELCLEPLGLSATDAAKGLGVSRKTLPAILNGRSGINPGMALRQRRGIRYFTGELDKSTNALCIC